MVAAACGRIGFHTTGLVDSGIDNDAVNKSITWAQVFVQHEAGPGVVDTFPARAVNAGDAIVLELSCTATTVPTAVSVTAPGWTFYSIAGIDALVTDERHLVSFGAIAPDTSQVSVTVAWTIANCDVGRTELGDEFASADPTGGQVTFEDHAEANGTGDCTTSLTTTHADDAIWAACVSQNAVSAVAPGYTKSADDGTGNWSEYKLTTDPAGTVEKPTFSNGASLYGMVAVALKQQ